MYFRIQNATVSVTNVSDAQGSTKLLAQTTLRNMIGTKNLSEILMDREGLSAQMQVSHCERCPHNLHSDVAGNLLRSLDSQAALKCCSNSLKTLRSQSGLRCCGNLLTSMRSLDSQVAVKCSSNSLKTLRSQSALR